MSISPNWQNLGSIFGVYTDKKWFQQDGSTPHTADLSPNWFGNYLSEKPISRKCAVKWATHSPDFTKPDFFYLELSQG